MRIPTGAAATLTELRDAVVSRRAIAAGAAAASATTAGRPVVASPGDTVAVVVPAPTIREPDLEAAVLGSPAGGASPDTSADVVRGGPSRGDPGRVPVTSSESGAISGGAAPATASPSAASADAPLAPSSVDAGADAPPDVTSGESSSGAAADTPAIAPRPTGATSPGPIAAPAVDPRAPAQPPGAGVAPPVKGPTVEPSLQAPPARPAPVTPSAPHREIPAGSPTVVRAAEPPPRRPAPVLLPGALAAGVPPPPASPVSGGLAQCRPEPPGAGPDHPASTDVAGSGSSAGAGRAGGVGETKVAAAVVALLAERGKLPGALAVAHAAIRNGSVEALLYGRAQPSPAGRPEPPLLAGDEPSCARDVGAPRVEMPAARAPAATPRSAPSPLVPRDGESRLGDALVAALPVLRAPQTFERLVDGLRRAFVAPAHADASPSPHAAPGLARAAALYGSAPAAPARAVAVEEDAYASERLAFAPRPAVWNEAAAVRAQIEHELAQRDRRAPRRRGPSLDDLIGGALHDLVDALFDEAVHLCTEGSGDSRSLLGELVAAARAISSRVVQRHGTAFDRLVPGGVTAPLVDALLSEILGGVPVASRRALLVLVSAPRAESAAALLLAVPPANTRALVAVAPAIAPFASGIGTRMGRASAGIASLVVYTLVGRADLLTPCADPELVRARTRRLLAELAELEGAP